VSLITSADCGQVPGKGCTSGYTIFGGRRKFTPRHVGIRVPRAGSIFVCLKGIAMFWGRKVVLSAVLVLIPGLGMAYRAINWHEVYPVSNTVFEVVGRVGSGAADYWCGAADYVRSALGDTSLRRIYIWRGIGPSVAKPGFKAVQFALAPPENADTTPGLTLSVKAVGDNLTSIAAFQYCLSDDRFDPFVPWGW
jgi:hypothetical protein